MKHEAERAVAGAPDAAWLRRQVILLAGSALFLLLVFGLSDLDRQLAQPFYDAASQQFPWREQGWVTPVLYDVPKFISLAGAAICVLLSLFGIAGRLTWLPPRNAWVALLGLILIPSSVAALKLLTNRYCPWDLAEFGGFAPHLPWFASLPEKLPRGLCFPASHAATGFMWLAVAIALHDHSPRLARQALIAAWIFGSLMGLGRQIQGGHFLSHTLWSAWLAWAICVLLSALFLLPRRR
jgi:membrane-associated PAP2 superfamily phosphatase